MTTESTPDRRAGGDRGPVIPRPGRDPVAPIVLRTVGVSLGVGVAGALVALAVAGTEAFWSVLLGTAIVTAVVGGGALAVSLVAGLMPAAALMVALLTYFLQVLTVLMVLLALDGAAVLDDGLRRGWVAAAVIGGVLVWMVGQVVVTVRSRIPVYDLRQGRPADGWPAS